MDNMIFRAIVKEDLDEIFLLLQQLTEIYYSDRDKEKCWEFIFIILIPFYCGCIKK